MNSNKDKLEKRLTRPQTIASAFGGLMKIFGARASTSELSDNWNEIVGENISKITKLIGIRQTADKKFNITVRAANPAFALQLSYQKGEITNHINKYFGYAAVNKITIKK